MCQVIQSTMETISQFKTVLSGSSCYSAAEMGAPLSKVQTFYHFLLELKQGRIHTAVALTSCFCSGCGGSGKLEEDTCKLRKSLGCTDCMLSSVHPTSQKQPHGGTGNKCQSAVDILTPALLKIMWKGLKKGWGLRSEALTAKHNHYCPSGIIWKPCRTSYWSRSDLRVQFWGLHTRCRWEISPMAIAVVKVSEGDEKSSMLPPYKLRLGKGRSPSQIYNWELRTNKPRRKVRTQLTWLQDVKQALEKSKSSRWGGGHVRSNQLWSPPYISVLAVTTTIGFRNQMDVQQWCYSVVVLFARVFACIVKHNKQIKQQSVWFGVLQEQGRVLQ